MSRLSESLPPPGRGSEGVEALLDAFAPRTLGEIAGPRSSGSSSMLVALISRITRAGGLAVLVDAADAFDPAGAASAGADLSRLLWVKCGGRPDLAWRAADSLARCAGIALVACDLGDAGGDPAAPSLCRRLQRAVEQSGARLVLRAPRPLAGTAAALALSMRRLEAEWVGVPRPTRLAALVCEARVLRARTAMARPGQRIAIRWEP